MVAGLIVLVALACLICASLGVNWRGPHDD